MDMLLEVEGCRYHFEFQLLEGNMAIRMYEYSVKETIRDLKLIRESLTRMGKSILHIDFIVMNLQRLSLRKLEK